MHSSFRMRRALVLCAGLCGLLAVACGRGSDPAAEPPSPPPRVAGLPEKASSSSATPALRDEIPPDQMGPVLDAHYRGLGHMERYEYAAAAAEFEKVRALAPGWIPGSINLAIALLNQIGSQVETAKSKGESPPPSNFDRALELFNESLKRDPASLHAHYCRGIILEYQGEMEAAHRDFAFVAEKDPNDAHVWYHVAYTLPLAQKPEDIAAQLALYKKAVACNPNLVPAVYNVMMLSARAGDREAQKKALERFTSLNRKRAGNPAGSGEFVENFYGSTEMGRYACVVGPQPPSNDAATKCPPPKFEKPRPFEVQLPENHRWAQPADFSGKLATLLRARRRFGAAVASFDANGDGKRDVYLAAAVTGPQGLRDALLLNLGAGRFQDATSAFGLPEDRASLGVAVGDFDADGHLDLFLTGLGDNRLFRSLESKRYEDVTKKVGISGPASLSVAARWLDIDQDGDLDLYVVNYTDMEHAEVAFTDATLPLGVPNDVYRNDGKPAPVGKEPPDNWAPRAVANSEVAANEGLSLDLKPWPDAEGLLGGKANHTGVAALDIDNDRDVDLVLTAQGGGTIAVLNDRLGKFHTETLGDIKGSPIQSGVLVMDIDKDERPDLVTVAAAGRLGAWRNVSEREGGKTTLRFESWPADPQNWCQAQAADLDLDGSIDLIGMPSLGAALVADWVRNMSGRLAVQSLPLVPTEPSAKPVWGFAYADIDGPSSPLPDLILVREGKPPEVAQNLGNGQHWLALELAGRWKYSLHDYMRTNPQAIGARVRLTGESIDAAFEHTTPDSGPVQSTGPVFLGIGKQTSAPLVRVFWPDGTLQCEMNQPIDKQSALVEYNRKYGSCPVLFAFDGQRYVCVADFLGGGGLGYVVAPGVTGEPDRDEALAVSGEQLREHEGKYRLVVAEPMLEVAYLDQLTLDVVDCPPGITTAPDERFVPEGKRPSGQLLAWRKTIEPKRATDLRARDVTELLRADDRRTVDSFRRLGRWIGYAEEHGIVLDFGDRLSQFGPNDRLVLCLAGWVEYPYSQTNYAAATAGVALKPPVLERQKEDGSWETIEPNPGYPAGLPRLTTLELTGKLLGPNCVLRLRTNMECYWDQAFVAIVTEPKESQPRVTSLPVAQATLGYKGAIREASTDGRPPLLYDYERVDPVPLPGLAGKLTRYGDVAALLQKDDDQLCLVGPGDEVKLEFDATAAPALPAGWRRSYVLRSVGYCKDADPFTVTSDDVGPLPWRNMPAYPFGPAGERPRDKAYGTYLETYQTRSATTGR